MLVTGFKLISAYVILSTLSVSGFPCDREDLRQIGHFPGLETNSQFTKTKKSNAGEDYCRTDFYVNCLTWCAYDEYCVSVHMMFEGTTCICHKCYLLYDQLPSPVHISYGKSCNAGTLGFASVCISLICREKQHKRMVARFGSLYEEVPLLDSRAWMSSVRNDDLVQFGPHLAVDDALDTFAGHKEDDVFRDSGYHWIIVELPFRAQITHVKVLPPDAKPKPSSKSFKRNPGITGVYLLNWDILSVGNLAQCADWVTKDNSFLGSRVLIVGLYFRRESMCVFGNDADPKAWRSATGISKLRVQRNGTSCNLMKEKSIQPWKELKNCDMHALDGSSYGSSVENLQGSQLLVAYDMSSVPEALFSSESGVFYKDKNDGRKIRKFNKLISWKYWTHCGDFAQTLSHTFQGKATIVVNPTCRVQYSSFLAIRSKKALSIADIQVFQVVTTKPKSLTYQIFACPETQSVGFTRDFIGSYIRPHYLRMNTVGDIFTQLNDLFNFIKLETKDCMSRRPNDLKNGPYTEPSAKCYLKRSTMKSKISSFAADIVKFKDTFAKASLNTNSADDFLHVLDDIMKVFIGGMGGRSFDHTNVTVKQNWTAYLYKQFHPTDQLEASLLHKMGAHLYTKIVGPTSKLRDPLYADSHICFVTCHWAHRYVLAGEMADSSKSNVTKSGTKEIVALYDWFKEAFCPNPCFNAKCKRIKNSEEGQCSVGETGFWAGSYNCICKQGYRWVNGVCLLSNPCSYNHLTFGQPGKYPCNPTNTAYCLTRIKDNTTVEFECVCHEGWGDRQCGVRIKPCANMHAVFKVSGSFACGEGINSTGRKTPFGRCENLGLTDWTCTCVKGRERDMTLKYDNCAAHYNSCRTMPCIHGNYVSSPDGSLCHCICLPGYSDRACSVWTGVWSPWSQWDRCRPECGHQRRSVSYRSCINREKLGNAAPYDYCVGASQRWVKCDSTNCWLGGDRPLTKSLRLRARYLLVSATLASGLAIICCIMAIVYCRYHGYYIGFRPPFELVYY